MTKLDFFKNSQIYCYDTHEICTGYTNYIKSNHWKIARAEKLRKENCCYICGKKKNKRTILEVHHKSYKNLGHENINEDLVTLCKSCHKFIHKCKKDYPNLIELPVQQILQLKKLKSVESKKVKTT